MKEFKVLNANQLKLIAIIAMLIDHMAYILLEKGLFRSGINIQNHDMWFQIDQNMRNVGRIVFPIFAFFIVEGYLKTRDVWKYLKRLIIFALISEIPFSLASRGVLLATDYRNVFWTLSFGLLALILYNKKDLNNIVRWGSFALCFIIPGILHTDYSFYGVLLILILYIFRENELISFVIGWIILMIQNLFEGPSMFGFALLYLYNGKRGKGNKYLYYIFYPIHILILVLVRPFIIQLITAL